MIFLPQISNLSPASPPNICCSEQPLKIALMTKGGRPREDAVLASASGSGARAGGLQDKGPSGSCPTQRETAGATALWSPAPLFPSLPFRPNVLRTYAYLCRVYPVGMPTARP